MQVASTTNSTIVNPVFDASGNLISSRLKPNSSGFGTGQTAWQSERKLQAWLRFTF